jgi:hypothetical protein
LILAKLNSLSGQNRFSHLQEKKLYQFYHRATGLRKQLEAIGRFEDKFLLLIFLASGVAIMPPAHRQLAEGAAPSPPQQIRFIISFYYPLVLKGLGPRARNASVISVITSANFWASAEAIHSSRKRSGSRPKSSSINSIPSALPWAFLLPSR